MPHLDLTNRHLAGCRRAVCAVACFTLVLIAALIAGCGVPLDSPAPGKEEVIAHKKLFRSFCCGRGESYGIPYRILLPRGVENLLTCGRCVSCDRHVMASLRVIPGCYITGQGAGMAAALAAAAGIVPRKIDTAALRKELRGIGAFFH